MPLEKLLHLRLVILAQFFQYFIHFQFAAEFGFRVKLIGITYNLLFDGNGAHIAVRNRQIALFDPFEAQSEARMPLADQRMLRITFAEPR